MRYSRSSLIFAIAIGMQSLQGVLPMTISFYSEKLPEKVGLSFGEQMDYCDDPNNKNSVRLSQMGLSNVGEDFVNSPDVKFITLENNNIHSFSADAFRSVPNLSCLNIRNNQISKSNLPTLSHDNLRKLNLANNKITFTSDTIEEWNVSLPRLTHLDLSNNYVGALPELFQHSFPSLTHLYFSGNSFSSDIFNYLPPSTEHLYLERSTDELYMTRLPPRITALFLNENSLAPMYIMSIQASSLRTLSMRKCKRIENIMYRIYANNLVDLDISSNNLEVLTPNMFDNFRSLQRLSLEHNVLSSFYVLNELRFLTDLSLNFNNITNITVESMGYLTTNLRRLHLRGNRISLIEKNAFSKFRLLEKLDLSENKLTTLPSTWMLPLRALSHLDLRSNLFARIDDMSVNVYTNSMQHLYLGKNYFTRFEISRLQKINQNVTVHVY